MIVQHISAFSNGPEGGNPAGVVLCDALPDAAVMQNLAAEVGYSETVFAAPIKDGWRARFFAPEVEVDFCGHATIALGAALARQEGSGVFPLKLNQAQITVEGRCSGAEWGASLQSPPTRSGPLAPALLEETLALFGLDRELLDPRIPPAIAHGGGNHFVLALKNREMLRAMHYVLEKGRALALREGVVTFTLLYAESLRLFHARKPFFPQEASTKTRRPLLRQRRWLAIYGILAGRMRARSRSIRGMTWVYPRACWRKSQRSPAPAFWSPELSGRSLRCKESR